MTDPIVITPRAAPLSTSESSPHDAPDSSGEYAEATSANPRFWVDLGAMLLAATLYFVFAVLPGTIAPSGEPQSTQSEQTGTSPFETATTSPSANPDTNTAPVVSPFRDAQLARAKEQAEKELANFVELQIELEDNLQITDWGRTRYDAVKDLATQGDVQFQAREFEPALATYREATEALEALRVAGETEYANGLAAGDAALADFNQLLAQREFERALRIKPDAAEALAGIERAEKLPQIQKLLRTARQLARRGDTQAATATYNQILQIDPNTATVKDALDELAVATTEADYQDHLSRGFAALESKKYTAARQSFNSALGIRPNDSVAKGGLQQIEQETEVLGLQRLQRSAASAIEEERWADAIAAFDKALAADKNLAFAQSGRRDARERLRLSRGMQTIVKQSEKLSDNARMREAVALLETAAALPSSGNKWSTELAIAQRTVQSYQRPVAVRLTSDNETLVTVYKVGRIGTFATHDLELRPGAYTIVGSADGCQDVRKEIIVKPQMGPVKIVCENRL